MLVHAGPKVALARLMANPKVASIIGRARAEGRANLLEPEAKEICLEYDIPTPRFDVVRASDEAVRVARSIGFPVVLEIVSPDIIHKTEVGGVIVNLSSEEDVRSSYAKVLENVKSKRPGAKISGVLVQKMAPKGAEVIVGSIRDQQFGQTILFGLGGIFVEILKDATFRIAPLEEGDAREMIREIKGYPVLRGYRNSPPADEDTIVKIILSASRLVTENPDIDQMDLNPIMVYERGATVVDARMILSG